MHDTEAYIVCNGYKDEEFIDLALHAQKMGLKVMMRPEITIPTLIASVSSIKVYPRPRDLRTGAFIVSERRFGI